MAGISCEQPPVYSTFECKLGTISIGIDDNCESEANIKDIFTVRNSSRGKVMFSQACVKNSVGGCLPLGPGGYTPSLSLLGRPLQRTVCILVSNMNEIFEEKDKKQQ